MTRLPRGVEERIKWMREHPPGEVGMCARTCWQALGGDYGSPPRWGCPDANCVYDKVRDSERYWRGDPPRGALIVWSYGKFGHTALSLGGGRILTTDPPGKPGGVGEESIDYPHRWGADPSRRIWTDSYAGTRFPIDRETTPEDDMPLSDADIDKIARKVWKYRDEYAERNMQYMLRNAYRVATAPPPPPDDDE